MTRWVRFNAVGIAGAGVQLASLWALARLLGDHYLAATLIAVEIAILHNFAWHEAWTWCDMPANGRMQRLIRFHVTNGLVSLASNTLLTTLFIQHSGLPLLAANLAAMAATSLLNFALASVWVLRA